MSSGDVPVDAIRDAVRRALAEDVGAGDLTTNAVVPPEAVLHVSVVYREPAVVAGLPVVREPRHRLGPHLPHARATRKPRHGLRSRREAHSPPHDLGLAHGSGM